MSSKFEWDNQNQPIGLSIDQLLYRIRVNDADSLMLDSVTMGDIISDSDGVLAVFDALVTPYSRLERKSKQLQMVMNGAVSGIETVSCQVSEPFKQNGVVQIAVIYELSDGQTVSVYFHNPDSTPNKLAATDEMISWKWLLNKKDITIVVAPEKGTDIAVREVGRRIMKLALKNSAAFQRANQKRAERLENIANLTKEVGDLSAKLKQLHSAIELAEFEKQERELAELNGVKITPFDIKSTTDFYSVDVRNDADLNLIVSALKEYKFQFNIGELLGKNGIEIADILGFTSKGVSYEDSKIYGAAVFFRKAENGKTSYSIKVKLKARQSYKNGVFLDLDTLDDKLKPYFSNLKNAIENDLPEFGELALAAIEAEKELTPNPEPVAPEPVVDFDSFIEKVNNEFKRVDGWKHTIGGYSAYKTLEGLGKDIGYTWEEQDGKTPRALVTYDSDQVANVELEYNNVDAFAKKLKREIDLQTRIAYASRSGVVTQEEANSYKELIKNMVVELSDANDLERPIVAKDLLDHLNIYDRLSERPFENKDDRSELEGYINSVISNLSSKGLYKSNPEPVTPNPEPEPVTPEPEPVTPEPEPEPMNNPDIEFINSVIANPSEYLADEHMDRLEEISTRYDENTETYKLIEKAVELVTEATFSVLKGMVGQGN